MKKLFLVFLFLTAMSVFGFASDPADIILGPVNFRVGDIDNYRVSTPCVCKTYFWTVTGGEIVDGQGTTSITVNWTSPNPGSVEVDINHGEDIVVIDTSSY